SAKRTLRTNSLRKHCRCCVPILPSRRNNSKVIVAIWQDHKRWWGRRCSSTTSRRRQNRYCASAWLSVFRTNPTLGLRSIRNHCLAKHYSISGSSPKASPCYSKAMKDSRLERATFPRGPNTTYRMLLRDLLSSTTRGGRRQMRPDGDGCLGSVKHGIEPT